MSRIPNDYSPAPDLLKERVILVTGAGSGIGAVAARTFAAHGASVILLGRTVRKLEEVYDQIEEDGGPQPAIYPMNLEGALPKDYDELATIVSDTFGRLDGILHNAASLGALAPLHQYDMKLWARVFQVNLTGPYLMTRALLPLLRVSADASVLFTSAEVGRHGRAYWGAYGMANAAIENMMQTWADELEANTAIRVNSLDPGAVRTHLRMRAFPGEDPNEVTQAEAIMASYLYLLGPDSRGITGQQFSAQ